MIDIFRKKQNGNAMFSSVASILTMVLVFLLVMYAIRLRIVNEAIIRVEDALAASALAALKVDMEQYKETYTGQTAELVIKDYNDSYEIFCKSLETNLGLEDAFFNPYQNVKVDMFIIYNVMSEAEGLLKKKVMAYEFNETGFLKCEVGDFGSVYAPNGVVIEETSVYAKLNFQVKGWNGSIIDGSKQLLTGIRIR